jgi:hypothetical protein
VKHGSIKAGLSSMGIRVHTTWRSSPRIPATVCNGLLNSGKRPRRRLSSAHRELLRQIIGKVTERCRRPLAPSQIKFAARFPIGLSQERLNLVSPVRQASPDLPVVQIVVAVWVRHYNPQDRVTTQ